MIYFKRITLTTMMVLAAVTMILLGIGSAPVLAGDYPTKSIEMVANTARTHFCHLQSSFRRAGFSPPDLAANPLYVMVRDHVMSAHGRDGKCVLIGDGLFLAENADGIVDRMRGNTG